MLIDISGPQSRSFRNGWWHSSPLILATGVCVLIGRDDKWVTGRNESSGQMAWKTKQTKKNASYFRRYLCNCIRLLMLITQNDMWASVSVDTAQCEKAARSLLVLSDSLSAVWHFNSGFVFFSHLPFGSDQPTKQPPRESIRRCVHWILRKREKYRHHLNLPVTASDSWILLSIRLRSKWRITRSRTHAAAVWSP